MVRERRRLLIPPHRLGEHIALTAAEGHYLGRVLRLAVGQGVDVVDGAGRRWSARLAGDGTLELDQPLAAPLETRARSRPILELAVALPRQDVEGVWRMATELGIDRFQPLLAERGRPRERWPLERWQTILREASEQCERLWLPELAEPVAAAAWLAQPARETGAGEEPPAPPVPDLNLLATTRAARLPLLCQVLQTTPPPGASAAETPWRVRLAIGPEGGWSPAEEAIAGDRGWIAVSAGPTILRTTTAAVATAAWLAGWRAALSSSSSPWQSP